MRNGKQTLEVDTSVYPRKKTTTFVIGCFIVRLRNHVVKRTNGRETNGYFFCHLHGKTEKSGWKIEWLAPFRLWSFRECGLWFEAASIFPSFKSVPADFDKLCEGSFSHHVKIYSFTFMNKISSVTTQKLVRTRREETQRPLGKRLRDWARTSWCLHDYVPRKKYLVEDVKKTELTYLEVKWEKRGSL